MTGLLTTYLNTRKYTEELCEPLTPEDFTPQSAEFASPPKWHLAHVTWFFEEMILKVHLPEYTLFDERFAFLFNSYYNSLGQRIERGHRGLITRPSTNTIFEYRQYVDQHIEVLLNTQSSDTVVRLIELGIQHEQQHQELLLTDLKYTFSKNPSYPVYGPMDEAHAARDQENRWISIEEGIYQIGYAGTGFCFDNELGRHRCFLEPFEIASELVTNQDFLAFIEADGYSKPEYWLDEGWAWVQSEQVRCPLYWIKDNQEWKHYTLNGLQPLPLKSPVGHLSYYEANAYARFKNQRLPTEMEWEIASDKLNWGQRWEWTQSAYLPYPGYTVPPGAVGEYNGKFMINQMVLRGASAFTSPGHSRSTYRNFFNANTQWQLTGLRLVK